MENMKKEDLLKHLQSTNFAIIELALYLDTHPDCPHARHLYQENAVQYNQARKQYAAVFISVDNVFNPRSAREESFKK